MRKIIFCALVILLATALWAHDHAWAQWKPEFKFLKMATSRPGGKWFTLGAPVAKLWEKALPGVRVSVLPGGGISNPKTVDAAEAKAGWALTPDVYNAFHGNPPYKKKHPNLRHLGSLYPAYMEVVVPKKSDIQGFPDLYNKRISGGAIGFTTLEILKFILASYDINFEKIKASGGSIVYLNYSDMVLNMKDGHLDAAGFMGGIPFAPIIELNVQPGLRFLKIDKAHLDKIVAKNPGFITAEIPKGMYKGQNEAIPTVGANTVLLVHKDLSEEAVYRMTKAVYENLNVLREVTSTAKDIHLKTALKGMACPIHPGAKRFYDEKGIR
ncbi:MAG: TAXI family TRAP transporter solute-binding subunit [Deltaproteobacteria bacterium]|nr:TAXI family TRAP transporter solute-binding subunit [Deltaproteobacteria bacterium]